MKISKSILVLLVMIMGISISANAQFTPNSGIPGGGTGPLGGIPGSGTDPGVPFDGGLSLILLAAGAGFGSKKLKFTGLVTNF